MENRSAISVIVAGWLSNMSNTYCLLCWDAARGKRRGYKRGALNAGQAWILGPHDADGSGWPY